MRPYPLPLLLLLLLSACALSPRGGPPTEIEGHYRYGFEVEAFRPCGTAEEWWVMRSDQLRARVPEAERGSGEVYARVRARVGPEGEYGHLGAYSRMITIIDVLEVREPQDGTCPRASRTTTAPTHLPKEGAE
jgi:hypothetical protein